MSEWADFYEEYTVREPSSMDLVADDTYFALADGCVSDATIRFSKGVTWAFDNDKIIPLLREAKLREERRQGFEGKIKRLHKKRQVAHDKEVFAKQKDRFCEWCKQKDIYDEREKEINKRI